MQKTTLLLLWIAFQLQAQSGLPLVKGFEKADFTHPDTTEYQKSWVVNQHTIVLDVYFDNPQTNANELTTLNSFLAQINTLDAQFVNQFTTDIASKTKNSVRDYFEFHSELINGKASVFLKMFHLKRIGIFPNSPEYYAVFDYSLDPEQTDYLLVVTVDKDGKILSITIES
ncbi:MAG: hypothetical protein RL607_452 [Bacteroidota bacterium]|jgi:hypothetical protein